VWAKHFCGSGSASTMADYARADYHALRLHHMVKAWFNATEYSEDSLRSLSCSTGERMTVKFKEFVGEVYPGYHDVIQVFDAANGEELGCSFRSALCEYEEYSEVLQAMTSAEQESLKKEVASYARVNAT